MKKAIIILILLKIISKGFGLLRELALSYFYGASAISDAYLISVIVPTSIFTFVGAALAAGIIPIYNKIEQNTGLIDSDKFLSSILNFLIISSTIIVILILIFTKYFVYIFASGFEGETLNLAIKFTRVSIFSIFSSVGFHIFRSYLHLKKNFWLPVFVGVPMNIILIIGIVISYNSNSIIMVYAFLLGMFCQFLLLVPFVIKNKFKYRRVLDLKNENVIKFGILILPIILGVAVNDVNLIIDKTIASNISVGGISALNYAVRLNGFLQGIIILAIATVIYPSITKMVANKNIRGLENTLYQSIFLSVIIVIPATIGAMVFSKEIIMLFFGRGAFNLNAISLTSDALFYYSIGILPQGLEQVFIRFFYANDDTKTPLLISLGTVSVNIVLNILFYNFTNLGIGGLALATSLSSILSMILLFILLKKIIVTIEIKKIIVFATKVIFASLIMILIVMESYTFLQKNLSANILFLSSSDIVLLISIVIGIVLYIILILILRIKEVKEILGIIINRKQKI